MTKRQYKIFALIEWNTEHNKVTTQREIYEEYPITEYEDGYSWNESIKCHDHCPQIRRDIEEINASDDVDKVVIFKDFLYKLAETKEETELFAQKYLTDALKKLKRHWKIISKMNRDGEGSVLDVDKYVSTYLRGDGK